ncbi:MAG: hypothetical protein ACREOU_05310 [Candidatus Eiseniibacteriota bacterium]
MRRRPRRTALAASAALALAVLPGGLGSASLAHADAVNSSTLPDSVVARLPYKDLRIETVLVSWYRLDPRYRPVGKGLELRRAFLDQLVEKEILARAALSEPFVMTREESALYTTHRDNLVRRALYRRVVLDSLTITPEDLELARRDVPPGVTDSITIRSAARTRAERRRSEEVNKQIRVALAPVWDDSVAALIARGFAALPPLQEKTPKGMKMRISNALPNFAPSDTGRVLVRSTIGPMTIGDFGRRFLLLNPIERTYPVLPDEVKARAEQFLGGTWFFAEAERRGLSKDPEVVASLAEKRESIALDHYYKRHVESQVDTSAAVLKAQFDKDPGLYAVGAHSLVRTITVPGRAQGDSIVARLAAGTRWEDLCAERNSDPRERELCVQPRAVADADRDTLLVHDLARLSPGESFVRAGTTSQGVNNVVYQLVERIPYRLRTFEQARSFVVRDVASQQTEVKLAQILSDLKRRTPVEVNESALAALDLGPGTN